MYSQTDRALASVRPANRARFTRILTAIHNRAFSEPVDRGDDSLDYIPTQIITETFKVNGFDGIAYKSSYGEDGFNVALFDVGSADVINCGLYRIKDVSVTVSEQEAPYFISIGAVS